MMISEKNIIFSINKKTMKSRRKLKDHFNRQANDDIDEKFWQYTVRGNKRWA